MAIFYNILHCVVIFCDIVHMQYYWNMKMFAILILQALILQGGDNIEILPNPTKETSSILKWKVDILIIM